MTLLRTLRLDFATILQRIWSISNKVTLKVLQPREVSLTKKVLLIKFYSCKDRKIKTNFLRTLVSLTIRFFTKLMSRLMNKNPTKIRFQNNLRVCKVTVSKKLSIERLFLVKTSLSSRSPAINLRCISSFSPNKLCLRMKAAPWLSSLISQIMLKRKTLLTSTSCRNIKML